MNDHHKYGFIRLREKYNGYTDASEWDNDDPEYIYEKFAKTRELFVRCSDISIISEVEFEDTATMWFIRLRGDNRARLVEESEEEILAQIENIHPSLR